MQKLDAVFKENTFEFEVLSEHFWSRSFSFGSEASFLVQKLLFWFRNFLFGSETSCLVQRASLGNLLHSSSAHSSTLPFAPGKWSSWSPIEGPVSSSWELELSGRRKPSQSRSLLPFTFATFLTPHFVSPSLPTPDLSSLSS